MASKRSPEFLTATEVASLFGVTPRTIVRWAKAGKFPSARTMGGHRRFRPSEVAVVYEQLMGAPMPERVAS